ncbi:MAG: sigma-E processing peptidase SpoIIGA [Oscillospiraceae bacterium]|nr:sigma-E processing peptidase SpoIIGA [Oscillospiraceae bacterium]
MVIYIDVLFVLNFYVTALLIKSTAFLLRTPVSTARLLAGAGLGGLSSLLILADTKDGFALFLLKVLIGLMITFAAFQFSGIKSLIKRTGLFVAVNLFFAGVMLALWFVAAPKGMVLNNGFVYFDISFLALTVGTAAAYFLLKLLRRMLEAKFSASRRYEIILRVGENTTRFNAVADTGNNASEPFSGLPVIIAPRDKLTAVYNRVSLEENGKLRMVPVNTINSYCLLPSFRPDSLRLDGRETEAYIGVLDSAVLCEGSGGDAIFNPKLLGV